MKMKLAKLISLSFLLVLTACSSFTKNFLKDPEVSVLGIGLDSLEAEAAQIHLNLQIKNPNPLPLRLGQVSYNLIVDGEPATEGVFEDGVDVPAKGESSVTVPLKFKYSAVGNILDSLLKGTLQKNYELKGSARMGVFSIPFAQKGQFDF